MIRCVAKPIGTSWLKDGSRLGYQQNRTGRRDGQAIMSSRFAIGTSANPPVRVGCAGWSLPSQYKARFAATGSALERYASVFNAVEINSSFYRPHKQTTYARWSDSVDDQFLFSVKVPKTLTHDRHLKGVAGELKTFLAECSGLGTRLGCLLVQLPPSLVFDRRSAKAFFQRLRGQIPTEVAIACEPRHASWFTIPVDALFQAYAVNRVGADPALLEIASDPGEGGNWRYWRLHGSPQTYYSSYTPAMMAEIAHKVMALPQQTVPWIVFDNTAAGHAVGNALAMKALLQDMRRSGSSIA